MAGKDALQEARELETMFLPARGARALTPSQGRPAPFSGGGGVDTSFKSFVQIVV